MRIQVAHSDPRIKPCIGDRLNDRHPLTNGLRGCWLFNEGSGQVLHDLYNGRIVGTLAGAWASSNYGRCLSFANSSSESIDFGNYSGMWSNGVKAMSVVMWLKPTTLENYDVLINRGTWAADWVIHTAANGTIYWGYSDSDRVAAASAIGTGSWQCIACLYTGSRWQVWNNGVLKGDGAAAATSMPTSTRNVQFSTYIGYGSSYYNGLISHVLFYNRALTQAELVLLTAQPFAMIGSAPYIVVGSQTADYTGSGGGECQKPTVSATGTYTGPVYSGEGNGELTRPTASATGTFTAPVYSGVGGGEAGKPIASAEGTFTAPVYSGSGNSELTRPTASATGTFTAPVYSGAGGGEAEKPIASAEGTYADPVYSGSGGGLCVTPTASAEGTFTAPVYSGSGGGELTRPTASASGLYGVAIYSGSGGGEVGKPIASAEGAYVGPVYSGFGGGVCVKPTASAEGTFTAPVYSGSGGGELTRPTASASGTYGTVAESVAVALMLLIKRRR